MRYSEYIETKKIKKKKKKKRKKWKKRKISNQPIPRFHYEIFVHPYQYLTFILIWIYSSRRLQFKKYNFLITFNLIHKGLTNTIDDPKRSLFTSMFVFNIAR